jgi:hypothetical protein
MMQNTTIKSSRELIEIKEDTAPADSYDIFAGYTRQEMPQGMGERRTPGKQKSKQWKAIRGPLHRNDFRPRRLAIVAIYNPLLCRLLYLKMVSTRP